MKKIFCLFVITLVSSISFGTIWLPAIVSDNMVLQADVNAPIWGKAAANSQISIACSWDKKTVITVKSNEQGKWTAGIKTPKNSKKGTITITCGKEIRTITNVLVGQVWLCSGQSNMAFRVNGIKNPAKELKKAKYPKIRFFTVKKTAAKEPQEDCFGEWVECNPETAAQFSAVGYFFGKELYSKTHKPIGLIDSSFGGTPAQAWTSKKTMESNAVLKEYLAIDANNEANKDKLEKEYTQVLKDWKNEVMKAIAAGKPARRKPNPPTSLREHCKCGNLYNAMIHPLIPFAITGAIWYQGESNADNAIGYRTLFPAMITDWRTNWHQSDFPFYFVQLAGYAKTGDADWPMLREAQTMTLALPNTGMAVAIDIGEANDIHPKNKQAVSKRLARWAMAKNYGCKNMVCSGPLYKGMQIEGDKIRISFEYAKGGLKPAPKAKMVKGFVIAGEDKKFVPANAKIYKDSVLVWSEQIKQPAAVRYGWTGWTECNLYNKQNLPASPFRTDNE
ncbi:MAG: sialate O-acetylesterase [Planctomycetaceae bacterium]|nr:sialate O-acetylesterase [Planctomycetaceae bacterium]